MAKKWALPLAVILSLSTGAAGGVYFSGTEKNPLGDFLEEREAGSKTDQRESERAEGHLVKAEEAYNLIMKKYVEKVDKTKLEEGAIQGMLSTLKDPYSVYMNKETAKQFGETLESTFQGIGAEIGMENGKIIIVSPYKDSPAEKAGLKPKDELLKIDGKSVQGRNLFETRLMIRGKKGTKVKMEIKRQGVPEPITLTIVRDEIPVDTVISSIKESAGRDIGYMEVTSFSQGTAEEFKKQLKELENKDIEGLVIDVRGNPGGLLVSVNEILGLFITKDKPYMKIEARNGESQAFLTDLKKPKEYPIAVLTDKGSASAAEILAAAMKEAGGYPTIGERTFGKGTVQQPIEMEDGSSIKLTLFKWLTPDGNWIHKKGIAPTVEVKQPDYFNSHPLQVDQTMKRDMANSQIKYAQGMLKGLGFEPGREDGYLDLKTEIAIKAFQRIEGLPVTGELNNKTAGRLEEAIINKVRDEENDVQLRTALLYITK
ncbi:S41 family peptidase [Peribacillus sp. SCS-155]|uniref:S41 family peptidase n=1 Tax=Peribacillus sedimenti TaxID=3115297 RepID=UPI003905CCAB